MFFELRKGDTPVHQTSPRLTGDAPLVGNTPGSVPELVGHQGGVWRLPWEAAVQIPLPLLDSVRPEALPIGRLAIPPTTSEATARALPTRRPAASPTASEATAGQRTAPSDGLNTFINPALRHNQIYTRPDDSVRAAETLKSGALGEGLGWFVGGHEAGSQSLQPSYFEALATSKSTNRPGVSNDESLEEKRRRLLDRPD